MHIVMLATENGGLPGGKAGGLGEVMREFPKALARAGHQVTVVTPGYGSLSKLPGARLTRSLDVDFCGRKEAVSLYQVQVAGQAAGVDYQVLEHPVFSSRGAGKIYLYDCQGPFETDAHKFSLFSAAACELLLSAEPGGVDLVHCHDWHTGMYLILREYGQRYRALQDIRTVFTIHNLGLQGTRPLKGFPSALESWFPWLEYDPDRIGDRRYTDCVNPMRAAINLADFVNTVSPTYAEEILRSPDAEVGNVSGEGLEQDLARRASEGTLAGILNGCDYAVTLPDPARPRELRQHLEALLDGWVESRPDQALSYYHASRRVRQLKRKNGTLAPLVVSIGRLCAQKLDLLRQPYGDGTVADELLNRLEKGTFILCGTGDPRLEEFLTDLMCRHRNFLFLCGYTEELAETLLSIADLFIMPSQYEPCGISQMQALRAGVPCLVHQVGGLKDTVFENINGFSFGGDTHQARLDNLVAAFQRALDTYSLDTTHWTRLRKSARKSRFDWDTAVAAYCRTVYQLPPNPAASLEDGFLAAG